MIDTKSIALNIVWHHYEPAVTSALPGVVKQPQVIAGMLRSILAYALAGNLSTCNPTPLRFCAIPTGFLGKMEVTNLEAGLLTVSKIIARHGLSSACEILKTNGGLFEHHSGPRLGSFEKAVFEYGGLLAADQQPPPEPPSDSFSA